MLQLHSFFNSSTSYRVRIALALKGLDYETIAVDIRKKAHLAEAFVALNPSANVPLLVDGDLRLGQSLAIVDWLDAKVPAPRLIPADAVERARVLEFASVIGSEVHPVNNLRVLRYLVGPLAASEEQKTAWYAHWIAEGLSSAERLLQRHGGAPYAFGAEPTLADCWLVPQFYNALRMKCPVDAYPTLGRVYHHCVAQPAFAAAAPQRQPDFEG